MTKSAMLGMTRSLSNQLISKGIRVNAVAPGSYIDIFEENSGGDVITGPIWTPMQPAAMDRFEMMT